MKEIAILSFLTGDQRILFRSFLAVNGVIVSDFLSSL